MTLHLTTTFISRGQKTATTLCGKKVAASKIALDSDATCTECRASAERSHAAFVSVTKHARETNLPMGEKWFADVVAIVATGPHYRSLRFL